MKSEIKEVSATEREIHITIPADNFKEAYNLVSHKFAKSANIPGFRKGFAPLDVVRTRYREEIKSDVLQQVVPLAVSQVLEESGVQPLTEPHMHLDDQANVKVNGSQDVSLHVHFEVMPEIPEPKYKGLELTRRVKPVADGEVDDLIANRVGKEAALIPVEGRKSKKGDTVIVDLEGTFDDDPDGQPITAEDLEVVLGDEVIEEAFTENLIGVKPDENKEFTVSYAEDFSSKELAGKTVHYKAQVKSVGKMETPEINDEWAKSLDEGYESLADLKKKLREDLEVYAESDADARLRNNAIAKLIEDNSFEVPNALIDSQARNLLNNFAEDLQQRGVDLNKVEESFIQMAFSQMRTQAERDVRGAMLLDKIAAAENVKISDDEINEELEKMAGYYGVTVDQVKDSLEKQGGQNTIENNLKTRKSIEALIENAKVSDGEWVDESQMPPETDDGEKKPKTKAKPKTAKKTAKKEKD